MYIVYMHTTPNGKVYVGITCNSLKKRWKNGKGYIECPLFYNAILKYGWDNIKHEVLYDNLTEEQAKAKEKEEIKKRKSNIRKYGYNLTEGGDGCCGYKHSEEVKAKMRKNHYDCKGKNNPMYGTKMSEEHKKALIEIHLGSHQTEETKAKISNGNKSKKRPKSSLKYGKDNFSYGRTGKLSPVSKKVIQISSDGNEVKIWDSITEASTFFKITPQGINSSLKRGCKAGGFYWKYA